MSANGGADDGGVVAAKVAGGGEIAEPACEGRGESTAGAAVLSCTVLAGGPD